MSDNHCGNCGNAVQPGDHFCQRCGAPVDTAPVSEIHTQTAKPKEAEERLVSGSQGRRKYRAIIVLGIGLLLIAAALGWGARLSGAPMLTAPTPAAPSTATRELTAMVPGPAVLQDKLVYLRTSTSTPSTATAIPKDPNDTFLVIVLGLPSNSNLYPEDLDWTVLDQTNREYKSVGFGIPLKYDTALNTPVVFSLFGRLIGGPAVAYSNSNRAVIALIFVVPKSMSGGTLLDPQEQESSFSVLSTALSLDNAQISTIKCDSSFIEQPNGSENWTITP